MKIGIAVGIAIAVLALIVCLAPLKTVAYTVMVDYEDIETYYETEPIAYEVVESYIDTESYKDRIRIVIGGIVFQDEIVDVFYPVGYVTVKNTDTVEGVFDIQFTFYAVDKLVVATAGRGEGLPDFDFADFLATEDPISYLASRNWDNLDWDKIMIFCEQYNGQESVTLQPGEVGTDSYSVQDIDIDKMAWKWEYTVTEPTKTVEKQRTVMKQRQETRYKKVTLLDYLLHYQ